MKQGVQTIKPYAFSSCRNLKSVVIPESVTSIMGLAFSDSVSLCDIKIGSHVKQIDYAAFSNTGFSRNKKNYDADGLLYLNTYLIGHGKTDGNIKIKEGTTLLADHVFEESLYSTHVLKSVYIPDSIETISENAFWGCSDLESVRLPKSIKSIGTQAFYYCESLNNVTIPSTVKSIGDKAFAFCHGLSKLTIKNGVTSIGNEAFFDCVKLSSVTVPESVTTIGKMAFGYYEASDNVSDPPVIMKRFVIKGCKATAAEKYTLENEISFQCVAPTNLGVTPKVEVAARTDTAIKLSWKPVIGATGYRVYVYNTKTKRYTKINDINTTSYTIQGLKPGTSHKFAVKAFCNAEGKVSWSSRYRTVTVSTKPGTPTLKVTAGTKKAVLSWNKQTGASGYVIYMSTSANGKYTKIATVKNTTGSLTKAGLTTGKTYYFKVAAYKTVEGKNVYGSFSAVRSAKVK